MVIELSKKEMIDKIVAKSMKNQDRFFRYEIQIMSKAFIEHLYRWYVLGEKVEQYDLR